MILLQIYLIYQTWRLRLMRELVIYAVLELVNLVVATVLYALGVKAMLTLAAVVDGILCIYLVSRIIRKLERKEERKEEKKG